MIDKKMTTIGLGLVMSMVLTACFSGGEEGSRAQKNRNQAEQSAEASPVVMRVELEMKSYLESGQPEQDVFLRAANGSLVRIEGEASDRQKSEDLYKSKERVEQDPLKKREGALGPFERGEKLGLTLGEWLAAEGTGYYQTKEGLGEINLQFKNLVPEGRYTLWCSEYEMGAQFLINYKPCGNSGGSKNDVDADAEGNGFIQVFAEPLKTKTENLIQTVALIYHSNGSGNGPQTGELGKHSHTQLIVEIPAESEFKEKE